MAFVEDFSNFLADFGDGGLLDGQAVRVIFDAPVLSPALAGMVALAAEPQVQLPTASVPQPVFGKSLVIAQGAFIVREHIPDGTGMSLLLLTRA